MHPLLKLGVQRIALGLFLLWAVSVVIFLGVEPGLEHHGNPLLLRLDRVAKMHPPAFQQQLAFAWLNLTRHDLGERGFAGTVFSAQGVHFALVQNEIDAFDRRHATI